MNKRFSVLVTILAAALLILGCETKTKYITSPEVPTAPVGVYSVTGDGFVDIYWPVNNDGNITEGYAVYRFVRTEGDRDIYENIADGDQIDIIEPDYDYSDVAMGHYRDDDVSNGSTYRYAISAYNGFGESDLSYLDAFDTPRPQGSANARDFHEFPSQGGFDFSRARTVAADENADVWFEYDSDLDAFFIWAANDLTDLQPYGWADTLTNIGWGDPGNGAGWSEVGWMEIQTNYGYIVWTADNHYAAILIKSLDFGTHTVNFDWSYQTDEGNPELKRVPKVSPPHDPNYGRRSGN